MTRKFKAVVVKHSMHKLENDTAKLPAGTPFIKILWKTTHEWMEQYQTWQETAEGSTGLFDKVYFLHNELSEGAKKTPLEMSYENLKNDLDYDGYKDEMSVVIGHENQLIVEPNAGGYDAIKYVNDISGKKRSTMPKEESDEIKSIFQQVAKVPFE